MNILITQNHPVLEIQTIKGLKLISLNRILFIKAFNKGSIILLNDSEEVETNYLLVRFTKFLPSTYFFRCHYSYLVNCTYVDCFTNGQIVLKGNIRIPLSRYRIKQFKQNLVELQQNE